MSDKPRSNFHIVKSPKGVDGIVFIVDEDLGAMSVTNDAERVTAHLFRWWPKHRIVYRDSEGAWDELLHERGVFKGFALYEGPTP